MSWQCMRNSLAWYEIWLWTLLLNTLGEKLVDCGDLYLNCKVKTTCFRRPTWASCSVTFVWAYSLNSQRHALDALGLKKQSWYCTTEWKSLDGIHGHAGNRCDRWAKLFMSLNFALKYNPDVRQVTSLVWSWRINLSWISCKATVTQN